MGEGGRSVSSPPSSESGEDAAASSFIKNFPVLAKTYQLHMLVDGIVAPPPPPPAAPTGALEHPSLIWESHAILSTVRHLGARAA